MPRAGATSTRCADTGSPTTSSAARRSTTSAPARPSRSATPGSEAGKPARMLARIPIGSIAWRTNVLSAVCAAVAVGVLYLVAVHITRRRAAAALAALAFAVSHTHWLHAVRTEVYALFTVLFALTLLVFS